MMLVAMIAVALLAASPALAQDEPAVVADAECKDGYIVSKAGGVVAKAPCAPEPPTAAPAPPPAPKAAPAPAPAPAPKAEEKKEEAKKEEKKELPKTGGSGAAPLFTLGVGALLVAGGLVARRISG